MAPLIGLSVEEYSGGRMAYDQRRLGLRGLIERIPFTRRYRVTDDGLRTALCYTGPTPASRAPPCPWRSTLRRVR